MRVITKRRKAKNTKQSKKRKNPMARKRKARKNPRRKARKNPVATFNPKHRKRSRKRRSNPVKIHRKRRHNPVKFSAKGILEQVKPIVLGAVGGLILSKALSYVPIKEEYKPYAKLGVAIALPLFVKHPIAKLGALFLGTLAVRDMIAQKFPSLVAGIDDYEVLGYDHSEYNTMGGGQVMFGADQVQFGADQVRFGATDDSRLYDMTGF